MVLAWKKFQVSEALMLSAMAAVCALLPSVSEDARNKASMAICRAIFLLDCDACSTCSACSRFSCALNCPLRLTNRCNDSRARAGARGCRTTLPSTRMCACIGLQQTLGIDGRVDLGC